MRFEKIIPVEEDNIKLAMDKAQDIFNENELTAKYLELRNVEFRENKDIHNYANMISKLIVENYGTNITKQEIREHLDGMFKEGEFSDFVFDEVIKKLEKEYNISFDKISI